MTTEANGIFKTRDRRPCTCGHLSVSHASFTSRDFVGVGVSQCGITPCSCRSFTSIEEMETR